MVVVLLTPVSFPLIADLYRGIYPALEGSPQLLALVRVALAILALAPATVLMGATLPTLTRHLARTAELSSAFSRLYAANTIGAIAGTAVAGFVLIEVLGLSGALAVGAACSGIAGVAAILLSRGSSVRDAPLQRRRRCDAPRTQAGARCRVHLRADVARLPGDVDAPARLGDRQHDLRLRDDPDDVPDRPRARGPDLRGRAVARSAIRSACLPPARSSGGLLAMAGLVLVIVAPHAPTPGGLVGSARRAPRSCAPRPCCP